ncbi:MAG: ankyrin repeat domain-containing protein [Mariniblastus sp.]
MPELFCKTPPPDELSLSFVSAVKARQFDVVDRLLSENATLRSNIDAPWFSFDSPAVVQCKDSESTIRVLLKHGADINCRSQWWAGSFGVLDGTNPQMVQFLIERGARFDIHSAAEQGNTELVRDLLDAEPELVNARGGDGQTPLHTAATIEVVDLLLERGADPSLRCLDHSATAAQYAVSNPEKCHHLIARGSTPDIFMACALGDREMLESVLAEEPDSISSRIGSCPHTQPVDPRSHNHIYFWKLLSAATPLEIAREFNQTHLYEEVFRRSSPTQQFLAACWDGNRERAKTVTESNSNLFDSLSNIEKKEMARAAWAGKLESVRVMLEFGFDPHLPGDENSTPLDRASFHGFREVVELLLEYDPNPPLDFKNSFGGTPLGACVHGAVHSWMQNTDHVGTARALLNAGANPNSDWLPVENPDLDHLLREFLND